MNFNDLKNYQIAALENLEKLFFEAYGSGVLTKSEAEDIAEKVILFAQLAAEMCSIEFKLLNEVKENISNGKK